MNLLAFLCLIFSVSCTLIFCLLRLRKPMCVSRIVFAPALLFCFICMNRTVSDYWIIGALLFELVYNVLASSPKIPTPFRQLAFAGAIIFFGVACYRNNMWSLVAPHINFAFVLFFFTVLMVAYLTVHPWLSKDELVSTFVLLLFNGLFAALGGIGVFFRFEPGTMLIALGSVFNFFYYVIKLFLTRKYEETRFGEFELMAIYIISRILLVFGFQLSL